MEGAGIECERAQRFPGVLTPLGQGAERGEGAVESV